MKRLLTGLVTVAIALLNHPSAFAETVLRSQSAERVIYDSPLSAGLDLQYSTLAYPDYLWSGTSNSSQTSNGVHIALEWLPFGDVNMGKLGFGMGFGYQLIKNATFGANSAASLATVPLELFVSYRFDYFRRQFLVPIVKVGPSLTFAHQMTDRGVGRDSWYGFPGLDLVGGVELSLSALEPRSARALDQRFGINDVYILFEYQKTSRLSASSPINLSHEEFRLGLRLEM